MPMLQNLTSTQQAQRKDTGKSEAGMVHGNPITGLSDIRFLSAHPLSSLLYYCTAEALMTVLLSVKLKDSNEITKCM